MTLTQLSYIVAVAQHKNFGAAAEACFVTQPTLSMQIQKLEEELGVEIFDRSRQPIAITELGRSVVEQARATLTEAQKLRDVVASSRQEISGPLRLGVIPTLAPSVLPLFISSFASAHPKLEIAIEELQTKEIVERLRVDRLDVGLLVTPLGNPHIKENRVFDEPFLLYVSQEHPLAKSKIVSEKDLTAGEVWLLSEGHCFRDQAISLCADSKRPARSGGRSLRFESGNLETLRKMVDRGGGYTLLPLLTTLDFDEPEKTRRLKRFTAPVPSREVSVVHHRHFTRDATVQALIQAIRDNLPSELRKQDPKAVKRVLLKPFE